MSIVISRIGLCSVLCALTALACGSGESTRGFGDPVEGGYQPPPVAEENGSQPPNNLLACQPESGCQSCETPCDLCDCRAEGNQLSENEYLVCVTSPNCIAAVREFAGVEVGSNNVPDAQFLDTGDELPDVEDQRGCAELANQPCEYCMCLEVGQCGDACPSGS